MRLFERREPLVPGDVLARTGLARGDKVLAACEAQDGTWLLGTRDALVILPPASVEPELVEPELVEPPLVEPELVEPELVEPELVELVETTRLPWEQVASADWSSDDDRLRIVEVGEFGKPLVKHHFDLDEPASLLPFLRERVTATVVLQRRVAVHGKQGLLVIARRPPSGRGAVTWAYELDAGLDPDDPVVRDLAEGGLRAAAEELGMI